MPPSSVSRLDEKLDLVLAGLGEMKIDMAVMKEHSGTTDENVKSLAQHVAKQNGRVTKVEENHGSLNARVWWIIGLGTATATTVGIFLVKLFDKLVQ